MILNVIKTKENKDGSLSLTINLDKEVEIFIKKVYNKKKFTKKLLERFVIDVIKNKYNEIKKDK